MQKRNRWFAILAWTQLAVSIALAAAIVCGYVSYQASIGKFVGAVAASVAAVSDVVGRTAETVDARRELLDQAAQMLVVSRNLVNELKVATENQSASIPQIAEVIRSASVVIGIASGTTQSLGEKLLFRVPTSVGLKGLTWSQPLKSESQALTATAPELKVISEKLSGISVNISRDGNNLSSAFIATLEQALKVIAEGEKTLGRLNTQDFPKAIKDLKTTSENLRKVSEQVDLVGNVGLALLVVGLILATWCFLHSLGAIILARSQAFGPGIKTSPPTLT